MAIQLTERDKSLLEYFRRFRAIPRRLLVQLFDGSESAAQKWVKRVYEFVSAESTQRGFTYYLLTAGAARLLGAPEEVSKPLGAQALQKTAAVAAFCLENSPPRYRYTRPDFSCDFPELAEELQTEGDYYLDFYLDKSGTVIRLGEMVIDHGGDYQKLVQKLQGKLRRAVRTSRTLRDIIDADLFCFAVIVANEDKKAAVEGSLDRKGLKASVRVEACADLERLLTGR